MKNTLNKLSKILLIGLFSAAFLSMRTPQTAHLKVTVTNILTNEGQIRVAIYNNADAFLDSKRYYSIQARPTNGQNSMTLDFSLPYGDYAITAYHDKNSNKNLDRSMGVPEEPYALSNGVNVKWRKPTFSECKVAVRQTNVQTNLSLRLWADQ